MVQERNSHSIEELKTKLQSVHLRIESRKKLSSFLGGAILLLVWLTLFLLIENIAYMSPLTKSGLLSILLIIVAFVIIRGLREAQKQDFIHFYRDFSRSSGKRELNYALDLQTTQNANPKLIEAAILKNLSQIDPDILSSELQHYLKTSPVSQKWTLRNRLGIGLIIIFGISCFSFSQSALRLASPWASFEKPNPYFFTVSPEGVTLEQGSPFSVSATFDGELPKEVILMLKSEVEETFRSRSMDPEGTTFASVPFDLNTDIEYYLEMDGYKSKLYKAEVQLRPRFSDLSVTILPPEYTGLKPVTQTYPFSLVQGYQGSQLELSGTLNKPLDRFTVNTRSEASDLEYDNSLTFAHTLEIGQHDTVSFELADNNGLINGNPFRFTIEPVLDEYPIIEIIEPAASFEAVEPSTIDILYKASDDFRLIRGTLSYELKKAFVNEPQTGRIQLKRPRNAAIESFTWDISDLKLSPKDELDFWIEVSDNDGFNGSKTSRSQTITLTVPSLVDYFDDLTEREDEVQTDLEDVSKSFEEMQDQYENFKDQLKEDPEVNYENQRQLEEVKKQQEDIKEQIDNLNEKFEKIKEEMSQNNLLSEETMETYQELKELMDEIDDPSLRDALEKLQDQMGSMSPEQLRDAMQDVEFNEELYKQRLERTLELFKKLKLTSDLEKLAQSYEDMARQEGEQNDNESPEKAADQKKSALEQTEKLKEKVDDLSENATKETQKALNEYQEMSKKELDAIKEELEEMIDELSQNQQQQGENQQNQEQSQQNQGQQQQQQQQQQQNVQKKFKKLAEDTRSVMQQMNQEQKQINIAGLQYILYSLLTLSVEQEDLVTYASATENRSQAFVNYARDQKNVEGIFNSLSDSLFSLSKDIPQFSNQINRKKLEVEERLSNSLEQMAERNQSRASVATRQALGGINEISFMIANLLEQLQDSDGSNGSSGGMSTQQMMEQLQNMGQNQRQLNQQIQDMINDIQGERLSQDQMDRLNQLSKQQNQIRQQLQDLRNRGQLEGGDKLASDLQRMIEDMEDTINDLRGGAIDPTLVRRQQNILSRMLEAEKAMQERDEEEKREGTTGKDLNRASPPELTLEELEKQIRNRLNDPNFTKYSSDYQKLIEKYFELLKQIQEREIQ